MRGRNDLRIVIAGAGIGGLATALSLHAAGLTNVRVLEASAEIRPLGVGLNILPNAVRELAELGVYEELAARAVQTAELLLYHRSSGLIWREPRGIAAGHRWPQLSIHRGHLHAVLAAAVRARLGDAALRTDARLTDVTRLATGAVRVTVRSARSEAITFLDTDVVVGADGLYSAVRATLYPSEGEPCSNGLVMWRGTTLAKPYLTGGSMAVIGDGTQKLVVYPIVPAAGPDHLTLINWVTARPAEASARPSGTEGLDLRRAEVLRHFGDWRFDWIDIPGLIAGATDILEYPMQDRDPLPRWAFGRVVLLGDAAHPMYPAGSNGATQAIIDGRALAYHLATHTDPESALLAYQAERLPRTRNIQAANRRMGPERAIDVVHQRAPNGFSDVLDVISVDELTAISSGYDEVAGLSATLPDGADASPYSLGGARPSSASSY